MTLQVGLCWTWSETPKTGFLASRLIYSKTFSLLVFDNPFLINTRICLGMSGIQTNFVLFSVGEFLSAEWSRMGSIWWLQTCSVVDSDCKKYIFHTIDSVVAVWRMEFPIIIIWVSPLIVNFSGVRSEFDFLFHFSMKFL